MVNFKIPFMIVLLVAFTARANDIAAKSTSVINTLEDIERVDTWTSYKEFGGIKIEYKFQDCHSEDLDKFRNLTVVLFRFTNTTNQKLELSWSTELFMDGECVNCDKINSDESKYSVKLDAKQVIEADCTSKNDRSLYIAANFIKLAPGMSGTRLTDFNFINMKTSVWK